MQDVQVTKKLTEGTGRLYSLSVPSAEIRIGIMNQGIARCAMTRRCPRCNTCKTHSQFYLIKSKLDTYCKKCRRVHSRKHDKSVNVRIRNKGVPCSICKSICDGTLMISGIIRCRKCFDNLVYGENPNQWTLPQRSAMLL